MKTLDEVIKALEMCTADGYSYLRVDYEGEYVP